MKHTIRHKPSVRGKPTFKHLAAAFAGAVMMSAMMLPGIPMATVHAAVNPNVNSSQRTSKANQQDDNLMFQSSAGDKFSSNLQPKENTSQVGQPVSSTPNASNQATPSEAQTKDAAQTTAAKATKPDAAKPAPSKATKPNAAKPAPSKATKPNAAKPAPSKATKPAAAKPAPSKATKPDAAKPASSKDKKSAAAKSSSDKTTKPPTDYKKVVEAKATAYASGTRDNDQWADKTYTGTKIRPGVIAVDPSVIPLGSKVYLEYPDGHGTYAVAEDTGGAIKGNRIDVVKATEHEASNFGIQKVKVYVVESPTKA